MLVKSLESIIFPIFRAADTLDRYRFVFLSFFLSFYLLFSAVIDQCKPQLSTRKTVTDEKIFTVASDNVNLEKIQDLNEKKNNEKKR